MQPPSPASTIESTHPDINLDSIYPHNKQHRSLLLLQGFFKLSVLTPAALLQFCCPIDRVATCLFWYKHWTSSAAPACSQWPPTSADHDRTRPCRQEAIDLSRALRRRACTPSINTTSNRSFLNHNHPDRHISHSHNITHLSAASPYSLHCFKLRST